MSITEGGVFTLNERCFERSKRRDSARQTSRLCRTKQECFRTGPMASKLKRSHFVTSCCQPVPVLVSCDKPASPFPVLLRNPATYKYLSYPYIIAFKVQVSRAQTSISGTLSTSHIAQLNLTTFRTETSLSIRTLERHAIAR